ncbi:methyltransferase domain-containing protein [Streptomyces phytophilus]|uniref:methyltransferase domain-containing protein n=1 Tax=Streptomyces phytophilus TaxID=722715 RepID=UPI0015F09AA6|nr:methyltransferase domain-containing protein [Streptomyces phytophilus]
MTAADPATARRLRQAMAETITESGDPWRLAFAEVPRHLFVPTFWKQNDKRTWEPINAGAPGYLEEIYSDQALTTQLDGGEPTSSTSQPSVMLTMLNTLDIHDGQRVLEIGTGTGYNAALLCHRLGDRHLATIDVDPELTGLAEARLNQSGYRPAVYTGDGAAGVPQRASFDRIIATCRLSSVPRAWLEQAADGAVIVVPIGWGLARLTVHGQHAEGSFQAGGVQFMPRRPAPAAAGTADPMFGELSTATPSNTELPVANVLDRLGFPLSLALGGYSSCTWTSDATGELEAIGIWTPDGSVARAESDGTVRQAGPRQLWRTAEEVHALFGDAPPNRDDFGLTVTADSQCVWFKTPDGPHWRLPDENSLPT